jgi:hypothetical protein
LRNHKVMRPNEAAPTTLKRGVVVAVKTMFVICSKNRRAILWLWGGRR